jgi:glycyl-tRNA synthetase (class II)
MNLNQALRYGIGAMLVLVGGCTTYYKVSDPAGNRFYYTTDVDKNKTGAITIRDDKTGANVTLQSSEVLEISREEYEAAIKGQPTKK